MSAKRKIPKSSKDLSKHQLVEILRKKKECNSRALNVVEKMSELHVDEEWMLKSLEHINQSHYDDIMTERALSSYCGYPMCTNLLGNVPKQQYRISLVNKTVYDITERKNFCSSRCYKSSNYLKAQILTSPLWFRDCEVIPVFKLFKPDTINMKDVKESSTSCEELKFDALRIDPCIDYCKEEDLARFREKTEKNKNDVSSEKPCPIAQSLENPHEDVVTLDPVGKVEKVVGEWFSISTYIYLLGEAKVRTEFQGNEKVLQSVQELQTSTNCDSTRFEEILRLFSILNLDGFDSREETQKLKPLPDYSVLKAESENISLKIKAFYTGQLEMVAETLKVDAENSEEGFAEKLPLVDSNAQVALRRRVLLDRLNRVVPDICLSLEVGGLVQVTDVRLLVHTFTLSAHNVTFKPREWFLMAAVIVKMLSLKIEDLSHILASEDSKRRLTLFLMSYNLSHDYLDNLIDWLLDPERLAIRLHS